MFHVNILITISNKASPRRIDGLDHGSDVAEAVGVGLPAQGVVGMPGHVIGHNEVGIVHFLQGLHDFVHVDVPVVRIDFVEIVPFADDVAVVNIK